MDNLLEIMKIIEGGLKTDRAKVLAYSEQLVKKIESIGDIKAANRIRRLIENASSNELSLAGFTFNGRVPVDNESRLSLADEELVNLSDSEIYLSQENEEVVNEFTTYVNSADRLLAQGVGIAPSLLIYGPPGCGKTELARNISGRLRLPILTARTDSIISSFLGSTAKNLRILFDYSMSHPCVLFLDEFDAVGKLRDDQYELGELKRVVVSLLQNIDAMDNKTILIAATNHEHLLDPAIWRRFSYKIHIQQPEYEERKKIFKKYLGTYSSDNDIQLLGLITDGFTGSDIKELSLNAVRMAVINENEEIDEAVLMKKILNFKFKINWSLDQHGKETIKKVRDLNPKVFTYKVLSQLFNVSLGKISQLLSTKTDPLNKEQKNARPK